MSTSIVKNIGLVARVGLLFTSFAYAESCKEVQAARSNAMLEIFLSSSQQREFAICVEAVKGNVEERRLADVGTLLAKVQQEGLRDWPKQKQLKLLQSLIAVDSFYSYFENLYQKNSKLSYSKYVFMGPAIEVYTSLTGGVEDIDKGGNSIVYPVYQRAGLDILAEQENPIDFLAFKLVSKDRKIGFYSARENFSPGMTKIILFEALRQKARQEGEVAAFNQFAMKLKLGFRLPNNEAVSVDFQYTAHDGYFLGATYYDMMIYSAETQVSFDCTSFVQFCAFGLESFQRLKVITYDFVGVGLQSTPKDPRQAKAMEAISEVFHVKKLKCESQLVPGDMIVFRGHMMIFKGYERAKNGLIVLKTIEAVGGEKRSLDEFSRRIYNPECNQFVWKRDQVFSKNEVPVYIVRFKG